MKMIGRKQLQALGVRLALGLHFYMVVWRVVESWSDTYWYLALAIVPFVLEGLYTIFGRDGVEWKQFSMCFFFYLAATLPGIWLLEIHKTNTYQNQNTTAVEEIVVSGLEIPVRLSPNTWVLVVEEMMLYFMIVGRWLLPRGDVGREQLTQLLFGFIGIASDIMELFSLFDEDSSIRHNTTLTYVILSVWSVSILQFTLTFATANRPRRARGLRMSTDVIQADETKRKRSVQRVELLATCLSLVMQDGPFLTVRLYTIVTYSVVTYSLVFFTAKNVLVILLLLYKIFLLLGKMCCPKKKHDDDEDEEEEDEKGVGKMGYGLYGGNVYDGDDDEDEYETVVMRVPRKRRGNGHAAAYQIQGGGGTKQVDPISGKMYAMTPQSGDYRKRKSEKKKSRDVRFAGDDFQSLSGSADDKSGSKIKLVTMTAEELQEEEPLGLNLASGAELGELQKVIDGPGTPAKSMERTKKYDKMMVVAVDDSAKDKVKDTAVKEETALPPPPPPPQDLSSDPETLVSDPDAVTVEPSPNDDADKRRDSRVSQSKGYNRYWDEEVREVMEDLDKISDDSGHPEFNRATSDSGRQEDSLRRQREVLKVAEPEYYTADGGSMSVPDEPPAPYYQHPVPPRPYEPLSEPTQTVATASRWSDESSGVGSVAGSSDAVAEPKDAGTGEKKKSAMGQYKSIVKIKR